MFRRLSFVLPFALGVLGALAIVFWLVYKPVDAFAESLPGMDNRGEGVAVPLDVEIGAYYEEFEESSSDLKGTWTSFRGEWKDNISRDNTSLISVFPEAGPSVLWEHHLGEGHGGASIYEGKVYILDYDEELRSDMLRCFDLVSGTELWRRWYKIPIKRNHGMSRTVPAVTDKYIVSLGPRGHVMCVNREDGSLRWGLDVEKEYGTEIPFWYTGQCPLVENNVAVIAAGGKQLMLGIDCESGEVLWTTPNPHEWQMSHASVMPYTFEGVKMFVYSAIGGACGVAAEGEDAGKVLWETTEWKHNVVAPSALCFPDGKVFLTAGYGAGSMVLKLKGNGGAYDVEVLAEYSPKEGMACEQQTPVLFNDHVLGILPKDAGGLRNQLICVHPDNFQEIVWSSGQTIRFGLGPYMLADGKLFILNDNGTLVIVEPSLSGYKELSRFRIIEDGADAWAPLAVADGYMVLRDSETIVCIDLAQNR